MNLGNIFKVSRFEPPKINPKVFENLRDPDEVTKEILSFLKKQSDNAEEQFKTSKNLVIITILIMIFQIGYAVWFNKKSNHKQNNLTKIIETQLKQSETISQMSLNLLDLQNQVSNLEKEKIELLKK